MDKEFQNRVRERFDDLRNADGTHQFELEYTITESPKAVITISGRRRDSDRWGQNKYATDANIDLSVDSRESIQDLESEITSAEDTIQEILNDTIGYSGPIILRSSENPTVISWARRLIQDESKE